MTQRVSTSNLQKRHHALYRFYDHTESLLYVGITADLGARLNGHRREKYWWTDISHIRVSHFATRRQALAAEREAIRNEQPRHNVLHAEQLTQLRYLDALPAAVRRMWLDKAMAYQYTSGRQRFPRDLNTCPSVRRLAASLAYADSSDKEIPTEPVWAGPFEKPARARSGRVG